MAGVDWHGSKWTGVDRIGMPYWEPDRCFEGKTVAILGCGPSLLDTPFDLLRERGIPMLAINNAWEVARDSWALVGSDMAWWLAHPEARAFKGIKVTLQPGASDGDMAAYPVRDAGPGRNGAVHAAFIAKDAGAARILLFGIDLRDDEPTHFFGEHRDPLRQIRAGDFARAREAWDRFANLKDRPEVINCSPRSALRCFPMRDAMEYFNR